MNIYVGNLSSETTEEQLKKLFLNFGEVVSVKLVSDIHSGKSKGFAFVEMPGKEEALNALKDLHHSTVDSRNIIVNEARSKNERAEPGNSRY